MAISVSLNVECHLIVFTCEGHLGFAESENALTHMMNLPGYCGTHSTLVDLRNITGFDTEPVGFMKLQARIADVFNGEFDAIPTVFLVGSSLGEALVSSILKSWAGAREITISITDEEEQALSILGLNGMSLKQIKQNATATSKVQ